jgi:AraC-like DNA-binding protein
MSRVETYSTAGLGCAERLRFWNDVVLSTIGTITVDAHDRAAFGARMMRIRLRQCEFVSPVSEPASIRSRPGASEPDTLNLQVQSTGRSLTRYGERDCLLEPGDFMLYDPSQPFTLEFTEPTQAVVVRLPVAAAEQRMPGLRQLAGIPVRGSHGGGALLSGFVLNAWSQLKSDDDIAWADAMSDALWPLLDMAYADLRRVEEDDGPRERRRREVLRFIEAQLCDPELSARMIADELGISTRYVQMVFARLGTTPSAYIQARRLDHAATEIRRLGRHCSITDVAYDSGFNDLSSFCRAFRRKFGVAARDYRAGAGH